LIAELSKSTLDDYRKTFAFEEDADTFEIKF